MAKRCCASSCYNSQTVKTSVHYFGFPKHREIAHKWLILAQRTDLLDKPLAKLVKYYLCSEHFTDDCFLNPPERSQLKRTFRPVDAHPLPSLFKCNIDDYIPSVDYGLSPDAKKPRTCTDTDDHNTEVTDEHNSEATDSSDEVLIVPNGKNEFIIEMDDIIERIDGDDLELLNESNEHQTVEIVEPDMQLSQDSNEEMFLLNEESVVSTQSNDVNITVNEDQELYVVFEEEGADVAEREARELERARMCRLCAELFDTSDGLMRIFGLDASLYEDLSLLMPEKISRDDGMPQQICFMCYTKMVGCVKVIKGFHEAQSKFGTGTE